MVQLFTPNQILECHNICKQGNKDKIDANELNISNKIENMGKGENAGHKHFLAFLQFFRNTSFSVILTVSQMTNFRLFQTGRL